MIRTYLDHASTSPLRPTAATSMLDVLRRSTAGELGDPSRSHVEGLQTRHLVEGSRALIAQCFGARPREVMFCSGATEAIATAIAGVPLGHTVVSAVEHAAVRMHSDLVESTVVGVDSTGRINLDEFEAALRPDTTLAHLQWVNHEVGTIQPVLQAATLCRQRGVLLHVDAAQAAGRTIIDFANSGIDLLSISGHKLGGPTGTGALLIRRGLRLDPLLLGGDQERARRAGIENTAGLCGFAAASVEATEQLLDPAHHSFGLDLLAWVQAHGPSNGIALLGSPDHRADHLVCLAVDGVEPQAVLLELDRAGIAVHSGNSCSSESLEPSPVLAAMGADAHRSLRISTGWSTTSDDIARLTTALPKVLSSLRNLAR